MRVAVMSDVHANLQALQVVLDDADRQQAAEIWFLGDLVVYGPNPHECIELMYSRLNSGSAHAKLTYCLAGNNDAAIANNQLPDDTLEKAPGLQPPSEMDKVRMEASNTSHRWTAAILSETDREFLRRSNSWPIEGDGGHWLLLHANPCDPLGQGGGYVRSLEEAEEAFMCLADRPQLKVCFFGHSHMVTAFQLYDMGRPYANVRAFMGDQMRQRFDLDGTGSGSRASRWLVNPGSVGQSRDGDPSASYVLFDTDKWTIEGRRIPYDLNQTVLAYDAIDLEQSAKNVLIERLRTGGKR